MESNGYQSPIKINEAPSEFRRKVQEANDNQMEQHILEEVRKIGIIVHKDELLRALSYDRDQYQQGYSAGRASAFRHGRWVEQPCPNGGHFNCSICNHEVSVPTSELIDPRDYECYLDDFCGHCGAQMDATE